MKRILTPLFCLFFCIYTFAQITVNPDVSSSNKSYVTLDVVVLTPDETIVDINTRQLFLNYPTSWISISSSTRLSYFDPKSGMTVILPAKKLTIGNFHDIIEPASFNKKYSIRDFVLARCNDLQIYFDSIPYGVSVINVYEDVKRGFYWYGVHIDPRIKYETISIAKSEADILSLVDSSDNEFSGIYEGVDDPSYKLAFLKKNGSYYLVFLDASEDFKKETTWKLGEVKAVLRQSAVSNVFKSTWYMADKSKNLNYIITFEPGIMRMKGKNEEEQLFIKMSRSDSDIIQNTHTKSSTWSGTGFALKDGYIVTNYHVVEKAKKINVYGVNGNSNVSFVAELIEADKNNDLAVIKVVDETFKGFINIPYSVRTKMADVGESVFVLGYPLTQFMGNEIKLTNGIISSRSGYQGDISTYQISAPVQPGNSGGPLFDDKGNVVGIVNAGIPGAENVGYAIKTSYLRNLIENITSSDILPNNNQISTLTLPQKVAKIKEYVFLIMCEGE